MANPIVGSTAVKKLVLNAADADHLSIQLRRLYHGYNAPDGYDGATAADLDAVKALPQRKWSANEQAWIVPVTSANVDAILTRWTREEMLILDGAELLLAYHLKTREVADIHLKERLSFLESGKATEPPDYLYATDPYPHQKVAFSSGRRAEFFAYLMEMGTGKTKVAIDVICDRARRARAANPNSQFRALIVAPKSVCHNWLLELQKHASIDMNVERLTGSVQERCMKLGRLLVDRVNADDPDSPKANSPVLVAIINYEGVELIEEALKLVPWDMMACDESTWIKTAGAKRSQATFRVGEVAKSRAILTGTPITKNVNDLYSQFHFLSPGVLGYDSYYAFSNAYDPSGMNISKWKTEVLPKLMERMARFSFVIKRAQCVDLPPKTYQIRDVEMTTEQREAYIQMAEDMIVSLDSLESAGSSKQEMQDLADAMVADAIAGLGSGGDDRFATAQAIIVQLLRLAQITSGYMKLANGQIHRFDPNPKLTALVDLFDELDPTSKVIVWCRFREDIEAVGKALAQEGIYSVPFYGGLNDREREYNIEQFKNNPKCRVFIGQPQSGGFGLNLTEASTVVYFSNDFSLQNRLQSEDRCHRIGQTKSVLYVDLAVPDTIDGMIALRLQEKRDLMELITSKTKIVEALKSSLQTLRAVI